LSEFMKRPAFAESEDDRLARVLRKKWNECAQSDRDRAGSDPKADLGQSKVPFSAIPNPVLYELGVALWEGARKYGRHNWRATDVRAGVYYDAALRHLTAWWEGEDIDPDSGLHHVTKAIASLTVLRDAQMRHQVEDDRPPGSDPAIRKALDQVVRDLNERYPDPKPPITKG